MLLDLSNLTLYDFKIVPVFEGDSRPIAPFLDISDQVEGVEYSIAILSRARRFDYVRPHLVLMPAGGAFKRVTAGRNLYSPERLFGQEPQAVRVIIPN